MDNRVLVMVTTKGEQPLPKTKRPIDSIIEIGRSSVPKTQTPMDTVIAIEAARMRLGLKKQDICRAAKIKAEMFSYVMRRGKMGQALPVACVDKIIRAITKLESKSQG